jgi:hypothetical protein
MSVMSMMPEMCVLPSVASSSNLVNGASSVESFFSSKPFLRVWVQETM